MKRHAFIAILLVLASISSRSQHCPWDGSSFIMLDVTSREKIKNIYLLDSAGTKVTSNWYFGHDSVRVDTAVFWRNADIDKNASYIGRKSHFSFAKDYYVLSFGQYHSRSPYRIAVMYEKDNKMQKFLLPLSNENIHPLCSDNKELWNGKIAPVKISL